MDKENVDEMVLMEAQVKSLQTEIAALRGQLRGDTARTCGGQMQDALFFFLSGAPRRGVEDSGEKEALAKLKAEVEEMEKCLTRQTQINNITLSSCNLKTLDKSDNKLVQQYCLAGHCIDLLFQVEFKFTEVKEDQSFERTITDLNIVMDTSELQDFSSFVSGCWQQSKAPIVEPDGRWHEGLDTVLSGYPQLRLVSHKTDAETLEPL